MILHHNIKKAIRNIVCSVRVANLHLNHVVSPIKRYSLMLTNGSLKPDKNQFVAVLKLQELYNNLKGYEVQSDQKDQPKNEEDIKSTQPPKTGLYLYGGVGTGKTLLLDLFYDSMVTTQKKRVHFNAFMLYLYSEINRWNLCCDENTESVALVEHIANKIMKDSWLLCFDEIQLTDYASCTILEGVMNHMIANGAVIVATSNRKPADLGDSTIADHFDGETSSVQQSLSSFKSLFTENCQVHFLDSNRDHRIELKQGQTRYFYPFSFTTDETMDLLFTSLLSVGQKITSSTVELYGRKILIPLSAGDMARFSFQELCSQPLGPADYIRICNNFKCIFVDNIPKLSIHRKNEARRLLSFIDAVYECRVKLYCSAEASPDELFRMLPRDNDDYDVEQMHMEMIGEIAHDLKLHGMDFKSLNIISGADEIFSFKRAISRLYEFQTKFYQNTKHRQQTFVPYKGTTEEREEADKRRKEREKRRQKLLHKQQENVDDNHLHESFRRSQLQRDLKDTDWGDEASYVTVSKEALEYTRKRTRKYSERQQEAPKFGEQHFWGFGWWEHVKNKIKRPKSPVK